MHNREQGEGKNWKRKFFRLNFSCLDLKYELFHFCCYTSSCKKCTLKKFCTYLQMRDLSQMYSKMPSGPGSNYIFVLLIVCHWSSVIDNPWRSEDPWPGSSKPSIRAKGRPFGGVASLDQEGSKASPPAPPHLKSKQPLFPADATAVMGLKIDLQSFCSSTAGPAADAGADGQAERPREAQGRRAGC